ncbi:MAG TPA: TonB-dependent receptor [Gemmatimonadaceae bacterium]|jgi:iron complex outermembrane receptor protein
MRHFLSRLVMSVVLISGFGGMLAAQTTLGTVTGKVLSASGEPVAGASVAVAGTQFGAIARGDGMYRINLRPGRYELRARLIGYGLARDSVTIRAGQTVTMNFTLTRAAAALSAVAVIGSRSEERTVVDAPAPIDVLPATDISATGRAETAQMIQAVAPSFNFPRMSIGDGTDHVRPATLRGLGADQVLVLINGKRRHTSALVNVNGSIGRGQAAVDLNAIPASMIERIEVLRDGASAQYGSDAIAGVINIVLKAKSPNEAQFTAGTNMTHFEPGRQSPAIHVSKTLWDGKLWKGNVTWNAPLQTGYLTLGAEANQHGWTNRSLPDTRTQYLSGDPRNSDPGHTNQINHRLGDAATNNATVFANFGRPWDAVNGEIYAFGGYGSRRGEAAGFWRRALDDRTVRAIAPNGFLPIIASEIADLSGTVGVKGDAKGWKYDLSAVYGGNRFGFNVKNSLNTSMGAQSPRSFDAGALEFRQFTSNLDLNREYNPGRPVRVGIGAEFRNDAFEITAGEPNSYKDGGVKILDGPNAGKQPAIGSQVFPGFRPSDAGTHSRSNVAAYTDIESDVTAGWLLSGAARVEHYSDFGSTATGKLATRVKVAKGLNLRGAVSTGFRAPSLHQSFFSSTATNFINGVPFEVRTFPVNDPIARVLGAKDLTPEKSTNLSAGFAAEPTKNLSFTVDYYQITITDRIVFSENFTGAQVNALLASKGLTGVSGGRYFTNAIDTRTHGIDVVVNYGLDLGGAGTLRVTGGYNGTNNEVTRVTPTPPELSTQSEALFGRVERGRIEVGQPKNNILTSFDWSRKSWSALLRAQRFGEVVSRGTATNGSLDNTYKPTWITDLSLSWQTPWKVRWSIGADNVLDKYPTQNRINTDNNGIFPYGGITPFGYNGRFIYTRLTYNW